MDGIFTLKNPQEEFCIAGFINQYSHCVLLIYVLQVFF